MGFNNTILQRVQNYEIMTTEKFKNTNRKDLDQPNKVTDFSINRILSDENHKSVKIKNSLRSEKNGDILDLSKHGATTQNYAGPSALQLPSNVPFTNYNAYNGLGPINFLMATKFYAQFLPHLNRSQPSQPYVLPPITTSSLPAAAVYDFPMPKSNRFFAPYALNPPPKVQLSAEGPPSGNKFGCIYNTAVCNRVNCADCLKEYYRQISLKVTANKISLLGSTNNTVQLINEVETNININLTNGNCSTSGLSGVQSMPTNSMLNKSLVNFAAEEISYKCFICDKVFGCSQTLQAHEKTHKSPRYECSDCGKGFSQLRNYKYHLSVHRGTKEFAAECTECGKTFNDKGYLSSHMKIHRNKKEYECPYCPKSFNQRVAFNMHVRIHTGVKPHKCTECGKRFSRKMLLKQHMRTHSGEKPYQCSVCGKSFADRSNMTLHHRLHSGIKPFSCPICPKAFTKKHHLKTHLNYHTGCKPYVCPHANCKQAFTQSSNMRTHAKKCQYKLLQHPAAGVATTVAVASAATSPCTSSSSVKLISSHNSYNGNRNNYLPTPMVTNATALHFGM